ncbi:MAG: alginate lyase family protein [Nitrospiraceae bacterium]
MSNALTTSLTHKRMALQWNWTWYSKRLSVMSPGEIVHRVVEHCAIKTMHLQHRLGWPSLDRDFANFTQFAFCSATTRQLPNLRWSFSFDQTATEALLDGRLNRLGHEWRWRTDPSVWRQAPDTGRHWPPIFFALIPYREGNPYGDVRVAWEPSRLQHLVTLALLANATTDDAIRRRAITLMETQFLSWIDSNPSLTGIHYISVMECGLRILAMCFALDLVRESVAFPERTWPALLNLVHSHADLIYKRLSRHSSAGNHTIAEAAALIYAGTLFPEMESASRWRRYGLKVLEEEVPRQILPDGGGTEQGLWYHRFVTDLYSMVVALLTHKNESVPAPIVDAAARSAAFVGLLTDSSNQLPPIGDGDDGYALSSFLAMSQEMPTLGAGLTTFKDTGYSLVRGEEALPIRLIFDHGPLGMSPCYGHGHADALSITLQQGRQDVLIDTGTYTYTGDPIWRNYFRGTRAHNTVVVDGLDQALQETAFLWSRPFNSYLHVSTQRADGRITLVAWHDGYQGRCGVTHWRALCYQPFGFILVLDSLAGPGDHQLELNWHFGTTPLQGVDGLFFPELSQALKMTIDGGERTHHRGDVERKAGWRSRQYGLKEPITTVRTKYTGALPHEFVTSIWLTDDQAQAKAMSSVLSYLKALVYDTQTH